MPTTMPQQPIHSREHRVANVALEGRLNIAFRARTMYVLVSFQCFRPFELLAAFGAFEHGGRVVRPHVIVGVPRQQFPMTNRTLERSIFNVVRFHVPPQIVRTFRRMIAYGAGESASPHKRMRLDVKLEEAFVREWLVARFAYPWAFVHVQIMNFPVVVQQISALLEFLVAFAAWVTFRRRIVQFHVPAERTVTAEHFPTNQTETRTLFVFGHVALQLTAIAEYPFAHRTLVGAHRFQHFVEYDRHLGHEFRAVRVRHAVVPFVVATRSELPMAVFALQIGMAMHFRQMPLHGKTTGQRFLANETLKHFSRRQFHRRFPAVADFALRRLVFAFRINGIGKLVVVVIVTFIINFDIAGGYESFGRQIRRIAVQFINVHGNRRFDVQMDLTM